MNNFQRWLGVFLLNFIVASPAIAMEWNWSLDGAGVISAGTLTTEGKAASFESVISINGTFNGWKITGLFPLNEDPQFIYDNQFTYSIGKPYFSVEGLLLTLDEAPKVNIGYSIYLGYYATYYSDASEHGKTVDFDDLAFFASPVLVSVPEPTIITSLLGGLLIVGRAHRSRRRRLHRVA